MFCPECGREVSADDSFCTSCGCYIRPSLQQTGTTTYSYVPEGQPTETYTDPYVFEETYRKKSSKGAAVAAVIVVAIIVIAAAVMLPMVQTNLHGSLYGKSFSSGVELGNLANADEEFCATAVSGFGTDGSLAVSGSCVTVTLSEALQQTYSTVTWTVTRGSESVTPDSQTDSSVTFNPGYYDSYTVTAACSDGGPAVNYTFGLRVDVYHSYAWKFDGGKFSFSISYNSDEYTAQRDDDTYEHRTVSNQSGCIQGWAATTGFVVITPTIVAIESYLKDLYTKAYGSCTANQGYADFILSWVQLNFTYALDEDQYFSSSGYKDEDYYAYPMETVYSGKGDCEDTSFLLDAVYKQAGYQTAVVIIPGHAMAAVALSDYKEPELSSGEILKHMVNGIWYYACETTVSGYQPVGASGGTYNGQYYSNYIGHSRGVGGYYGFYPVEDSE